MVQRARKKSGKAKGTPAFGFMNWGGKRKGAGRKAERRADGRRARGTHERREKVTRHTPVHVTVRVVDGLASLRGASVAPYVLEAIGGGNQREDFRVVHLSVQSNHVHLICEAHSSEALTRGMKGVNGRVARAVNRAVGRRGQVIEDRYHAHVLRTKSEVRNAVRYVLKNNERHEVSAESRSGRGWWEVRR